MKLTHNKKRNVGIIYEQLVRKVSEALVEGDMKRADLVLEVIKNNFSQDTELYKEFRLFNALVKTTVSSDSIATRILSEAKLAAQDHDASLLRKQKSKLIKEINHALDDNSFYSTRIQDYRTYATIQTLLNDWRKPETADIKRIAQYEDQIHNWLLKEKKEAKLDSFKTQDVDKLTVKIMREKFNTRYGKTLTLRQRNLIREFVFSKESGDSNDVKQLMEEHQEEILQEIKRYATSCSSDYMKKKIPLVIEAVRDLNTDDTSDENIAKFLTTIRLSDEITEGKHE